MARPVTPEERAAYVRLIVEETMRRPRFTVTEAQRMFGLNRATVQRYFNQAAAGGQVIRYGRCGLFRDQRAILDFDLKRYSYRRKPEPAKPDFSNSEVFRRTLTIFGARP